MVLPQAPNYPCHSVVALLGGFIHSMATKVDPDYTIGLLTSFTMPETGVQQLEECIAAYADDRNGDGKVVHPCLELRHVRTMPAPTPAPKRPPGCALRRMPL